MRYRHGFLIVALCLAACSSGVVSAQTISGTTCATRTPITLQLKWTTQSQFAGYYAAAAQGLYAAHCLDVTIVEGGVETDVPSVVASGQAEFGIAWVPETLAARAQGADLVNIAQVFQRSGTLEVSWAANPVPTIADMAGKRVGTWGGGNVHELFAALRNADIDPANPADVTIVPQSFDMQALLDRQLDVAQATIYNEYAQVLEATNPATGQLYQPQDLVTIDFNEVGTAMLQDSIIARQSWLADTDHEALAVQFLAASFQGWQFCRDNLDACVQIVLDHGPKLGKSHMRWQLNEVNKLIWPSTAGIGVMDPALWEQTVAVALEGGVITAVPSEDAYRADLTQTALAQLPGDRTGQSYHPVVVTLQPGGV